jgi:LysM repeat protein
LIHTVASYQTLTTISQAYGVTIDTILALNGIQEDWPLQIGQKLVIKPGMFTPSPTPRPLTPVEKLTPASDGKYYHEILSGETLSWVAQLYGVNIFDLMAWNGLNESSIIQPGQKILLQVTPPATITPTPAPATMTPTNTQVTPTLTLTLAPTGSDASPTVVSEIPSSTGRSPFGWLAFISVMIIALILVAIFARRKMAKY